MYCRIEKYSGEFGVPKWHIIETRRNTSFGTLCDRNFRVSTVIERELVADKFVCRHCLKKHVRNLAATETV